MDWRTFHDFTNHRPDRAGGHIDDPGRPRPLDPSRMPQPFKDYLGQTASVDLVDHRRSWVDDSVSSSEDQLDLETLSRLLLLGAGTKRFRRMPDRYFRTYASAGALHPNEVYLAAAPLDGCEAGLYHFHPRDKKLVALGKGDPRPLLVAATGDESLLDQPAIFVISGIPWRTSWKYGPRGYRHLWWDAGMIIANLLALADSLGLPSRILVNFVDDEVNRLIGADGRSEMALSLVAMGQGAVPSASDYSAVELTAEPISSNPFEYPEITTIHQETSLKSIDEIRREPATAGNGTPLDHVEKVIWKRGSTRRFDRAGTIEREILERILAYADAPMPCDWKQPINEMFVIANAVDGLEAGAYRWAAEELEQIGTDQRSRDAALFLSLNQALGRDASAVVFPMADLRTTVDAVGARGYRAAQLEGAIMSGRLYLASYAAGYGATGLTFFDEGVSKYFETRREPMLEVALGTPSYGLRMA